MFIIFSGIEMNVISDIFDVIGLVVYKNIKDVRNITSITIIVSLICALATVYLTLRIPILTGKAVDCIIGPGEIDYDRLIAVLQQMAVTVAATFFTQWIMNRVNNAITYNVTKSLRDRAFAKLQHMKLSMIDSHPHGDYVSRIVSDADTFADGLLMGFTQFFTGVLTILGTIYFMVMINKIKDDNW